MQLERRQTPEPHIDGREGPQSRCGRRRTSPSSARIVTTDVEDVKSKGEEYAMQVSGGTRLTGTVKLDFRSDGSLPRFYHIDVKTAKRETDPDPTQYTFLIRPDQKPEVALLAPTADLDMPANGVIPLVIQAADPDFLLRSIVLKAERKGDAFPDEKLFESELPRQSYRGKYDFALSTLRNLEPATRSNSGSRRRTTSSRQPTATRLPGSTSASASRPVPRKCRNNSRRKRRNRTRSPRTRIT